MTKAIITDLDGTILPHGGKISPATLQSLAEAEASGITRIVATGRNLFAARKVIPENMPIDYLVFSSGAGILRWTDKEIIFSKHLDLQATRSIASYLWEYAINFTIQREIPDNHHFYYTNLYPAHEDYKHRLKIFEAYGTCIETVSDIRGGATQFVMILDARQLHLLEQIRKDLSQYSVIRSTSPVDNRAIWLEIFPQGVNKGTICRHLLESLTIPCAECAGIGNDYNDVDFLDLCGQAYMVANAPTKLRPHYKSVASDREDGFSEFIRLSLK